MNTNANSVPPRQELNAIAETSEKSFSNDSSVDESIEKSQEAVKDVNTSNPVGNDEVDFDSTLR